MANMPVIDMVRTGQNIGRLRKQAGLSVKDLQDVFGFATPQAIYKWQQGAALPTLDNLVVLAAVLQVRMDDILVITDPAAQDVRGTSVLRRPKRSVDRFPLVTLWMGMPSGEVAMVQWTMLSNDRSGA